MTMTSKSSGDKTRTPNFVEAWAFSERPATQGQPH